MTAPQGRLASMPPMAAASPAEHALSGLRASFLRLLVGVLKGVDAGEEARGGQLLLARNPALRPGLARPFALGEAPGVLAPGNRQEAPSNLPVLVAREVQGELVAVGEVCVRRIDALPVEHMSPTQPGAELRRVVLAEQIAAVQHCGGHQGRPLAAARKARDEHLHARVARLAWQHGEGLDKRAHVTGSEAEPIGHRGEGPQRVRPGHTRVLNSGAQALH
mmetsp:Transcript_12214/g.38274  ORF Transcript_12214/g.38274 Transcript_12214/m.38274 type:complete len:220 (+) Transcript_12214:88-747(+)